MAGRRQEVERRLSEPEVASNSALLTRLAREYGELTRPAQLYGRLKDLRRRRDEARQTMEETPDDVELRQLAQEELNESVRQEQKLLAEFVEMLVSGEADADRDVIVEIRAGTGGEEAALFAADLLRMYRRYAEKRGWKSELLDASYADMGGLKEVIFSVSGKGAWQRLRHESGGHRVQRVPETESQDRIHTSLATVAVLPEVEKVEIEIEPNDLDISFIHSSGPGGQNVNKISSCVRIVHKPSGITVRCQDQKSQGANRKKAMKILRARLFEKQQGEQQQQLDQLRRSQVGSGDRNERIRTYNFPQDRITDHRIGMDVFGVESFLMGDCDDLLDALDARDRQRRIEALIEES